MSSTIDGRYALLEPLGDSGMGTVHRARLGNLTVVVKQFPGSDDEQTELRWSEAVEALIAVRHAGMAATLDYGTDTETGRRYLVQEHVTGMPLDAFRASVGRPLTDVEAATVLLPITNALVHCHRRGISHGRLSPNHVLVTRDEHATARLVGMRPRGTHLWDRASWSDQVEDPEHSDALGLASIAAFLTRGVGAVGPRIAPDRLDSLDTHGLLGDVLGRHEEPMGVEAIRDRLLALLQEDEAGRRAAIALADSMAPTDKPAPRREIKRAVDALRPLLTMPLTVPIQAFRQHDGIPRMIAYATIFAVAIAMIALYAGGMRAG